MSKRRFYLLFGIAVVVVLSGFSFLAYADQSIDRLQPVSLSVSCEDFQANNRIRQEVKLPVHGTLEITLCSNPSTGYSWSDSARISNHGVIWQTGHSEDHNGGEALGSPGEARWTFKSLQEGTATISLQYSRHWEDDGSDNWTYEVQVTVVKDSEDGGEEDDDSDSTGEHLVRQIFEQVSEGELTALSKQISAGFQYAGKSESSGGQAFLKLLGQANLGDYSLGNFSTSREDQVLIVTYTFQAQETLSGEGVPNTSVTGLSVFLKTNSNWKWLAQSESF
ncbi:MAG: protease inhibitor I42 family protein [Candidatus Bipolaricaulota bacterium]